MLNDYTGIGIPELSVWLAKDKFLSFIITKLRKIHTVNKKDLEI